MFVLLALMDKIPVKMTLEAPCFCQRMEGTTHTLNQLPSCQYHYLLQKHTDWVDQFRDWLRGSVLPRGVLQGDGGAGMDPDHGLGDSDLGV